MKHILFIVGSLRERSFNHQLAKYVEKKLEGKANVTYLDYKDIPCMNEDLENPDVPEISRIKKEVKDADALWIFTPEYNSFIPGVLKNLLDWLSRKLDATSAWNDTALAGKKVTYSGAAGNSRSAKAQAHLAQLLPFILMDVMEEPTAKIKIKSSDHDTEQLILYEDEVEMIDKQVEAFLEFIEK